MVGSKSTPILQSSAPSTKPVIALNVAREDAGLRLDLFLTSACPDFSRARLQNLIRSGFVRLNGTTPRPRDIVRSGDLVELTEPPLKKIEAKPEEITLDIFFEDDDLLVLNKPAGMVVHPGAGHQKHTLVNALLAHCKTLSGIGGQERPGIVHRLDKETSGLLVVAKNDLTHRHLSKQFATRSLDKVYLALVAGTPRKSRGVIDKPIGRHPVHRQRMSVTSNRGRTAKTEYRLVRTHGGMSLLECILHSGRTHQIRVHLHHLGHPVLGDKTYGGKHADAFPRQMLHAWKLTFRHPRTDKVMTFEAPLPPDFAAAIGQVS